MESPQQLTGGSTCVKCCQNRAKHVYTLLILMTVIGTIAMVTTRNDGYLWVLSGDSETQDSGVNSEGVKIAGQSISEETTEETKYKYKIEHSPSKTQLNNNKAVEGTTTVIEGDPARRRRDRGERKQRRPQALIIGAMKCGTFALKTFITLNREARAPLAEVNYFHQRYHKGDTWYRHEMPYSYADQITIEKSIYFYSRRAPERIKDYDANMKILLILCDPVKRVVSHFLNVQEKGKVPQNSTVEDCILHPGTRELNTDSEFIRNSIYSNYLSNWIRHLGRERIHIVSGENIKTDPLPELNKAEQFLGLRSRITESKLYFDKEKGFFCYIRKQKKCLPKGKGRVHPKLSDSTYKKLVDFYAPYNEKLFEMIGERFNWTMKS